MVMVGGDIEEECNGLDGMEKGGGMMEENFKLSKLVGLCEK